MKKLKLVALDSNIFIYHFEQNPEFTQYTDRLLDQMSTGALKGVTSTISQIECLSYPSLPELIEAIKGFFAEAINLKVVDVNQQIAIDAARIRLMYGFRLPDAVQLATALNAKTQAFITNDEQLKRFKEVNVIMITDV